MTYRFGRLPAHPEETHPRLHLAPHLRAVTPPPSVDWYSRVENWPMFLNDQLGCCTEAMVGHCIENASEYGPDLVLIRDGDVLTAYERVSGYNPADPSTDQGAVLQDVYGDWRKTGVGGHKNLVFAQVNHGRDTELMTAVDEFGAVGLGIVVTQDMMDDFDAGKPWDRAVGEQLGGHAVPVVGYDPSYLYIVTWGRLQRMTWRCLDTVTEEAWVSVLPEWFSGGKDPQGVDLHGLGEAFAALTGQPNPFPDPSPQPVPPGPAPQPVDPADEALAVAAKEWVKHRHSGTNGRFADAVRTWLKTKAL
jgi:hypothetical protein